MGWGGWRTGEEDVFAFPILTVVLICLACVVIPSVSELLFWTVQLWNTRASKSHRLGPWVWRSWEKKEINITVKLYMSCMYITQEPWHCCLLHHCCCSLLSFCLFILTFAPCEFKLKACKVGNCMYICVHTQYRNIFVNQGIYHCAGYLLESRDQCGTAICWRSDKLNDTSSPTPPTSPQFGTGTLSFESLICFPFNIEILSAFIAKQVGFWVPSYQDWERLWCWWVTFPS